jgi:hypothetical protein
LVLEIYDKVRAEVESELARVATFALPPSKPAPKFANQPKREVKLNAAAILREGRGLSLLLTLVNCLSLISAVLYIYYHEVTT